MLRVAMFSVHTCPLAQLGGWETGGMNVYIRELASHLGNMGVATDVFTRRQDPTVDTIVPFAPNARVVHLDAGPRAHVDKNQVVNYLPEFVANLRRFHRSSGARYQIIHSHYWLSGQAAALFKEEWDIPLVSMFHTLGHVKNHVVTNDAEYESPLRVQMEKAAMGASDLIIAPTSTDMDHIAHYYDVPRRKLTVVPCGVDRALFHPIGKAEARRQLHLRDKKLVLFVGRLQQLKGIDVLLQALGCLKESRNSDFTALRLLIVGGRPSDDEDDPESAEVRRLKALATQLGVAEKVTFVGAVDQKYLPLYYSAADLTVVPSLYESFGLVALESMACGTPVVASQVGGLETTIQDGRTGYLIPWRDPCLFAEKMGLLLGDPSLREIMGREAATVSRQYSWECVAQRIAELYSQLLSGDYSRPVGASPRAVIISEN